MTPEQKEVAMKQTREELIKKLEIWLSKNSQPLYEKGTFGETDTINSDEFIPALADLIEKDRIRIVSPWIEFKSKIDGYTRVVDVYEDALKAGEEVVKLAGIES